MAKWYNEALDLVICTDEIPYRYMCAAVEKHPVFSGFKYYSDEEYRKITHKARFIVTGHLYDWPSGDDLGFDHDLSDEEVELCVESDIDVPESYKDYVEDCPFNYTLYDVNRKVVEGSVPNHSDDTKNLLTSVMAMINLYKVHPSLFPIDNQS